MSSSSKSKSKKHNKQKKLRGKKPRYTAETADRHELYQIAVQSPDSDVDFLERVYREANGRDPKHFREDFCGTAILATEWIQRAEERTAEGYDLDPDPIQWGKERHIKDAGDAAKRLELFEADVREPSRIPPDVRCAQNFSYCALHARADLLEYFRCAQKDMAEHGLFVIDLWGGPESIDELEEERDLDEGFTYIWDQNTYYPGTSEFQCYIHFRFEDGTEMRKAFDYKWRLWFMPELKDALLEAGFSKVDSYFEGTDDEDDGEGNGVFEKSVRGEHCASFVAYLVAHK